MAAGLYYLLSFLPPLPDIGDPPPITLEEVARLVRDLPGREIRALFEVIELESTLQAMVRRRLGLEAPGGNASPSTDLGGEGRLPPALATFFSEEQAAVPEDAWLTHLWDAFYREIARLGAATGCDLLTTWSHWERSLRWQLAATRSKALAEAGPLPMEGAKAVPCQGPAEMPADLALDGGYDHSALIHEACLAQDPLASERILDEGRARFLEQQAGRYSFRIEELIAYILKLRLLLRHARLNRTEGIHILEEVTSI